MMKIKDFIKQEIDIDVYDDYDERCAIAFVGPQELTDEGKKHYAKMLDFDVDIVRDTVNGDEAIVHVNDDDSAEMVCDFFNNVAGYCSESSWYKWFKESDENNEM